MQESRLEYLFDCYVQQNCSDKEEEELMNLLSASKNQSEVKKLLDKVMQNTGADTLMPDHTAASILRKILQKDSAKVVPVERNKSVSSLWRRMAAAATILFICGSVYWLLSNQNKRKTISPAVVSSAKASTISPGGNHAILTLADGSKIVLDSVHNGNIKKGSTKIKKQGALLIYDALATAKNTAPVVYNTLSTPRGGQYQLVLPDGSKVWLNASSSIRFPTAFIGNHRDVDLTGEAYFEVTKNKAKPFHVNVNGMQVQVLGTHFNVNAYGDEGRIETSLLEGAVRIKSGQSSGLLKPGEQAILARNQSTLQIKKADMNEVMAWKNGLFQFEGASITTIMSEFSRWYDVVIVYGPEVPDRRFEGKISRDAQLSDVLKILELSNVKFEVEGKKILVQ
jgi:ferric-dicitrate binding protein FerR (iron transport regulator)